jgi:hypothetical protein
MPIIGDNLLFLMNGDFVKLGAVFCQMSKK